MRERQAHYGGERLWPEASLLVLYLRVDDEALTGRYLSSPPAAVAPVQQNTGEGEEEEGARPSALVPCLVERRGLPLPRPPPPPPPPPAPPPPPPDPALLPAP